MSAAEQNVYVALNDEEPVDPLVTSYLNRLSDFFFVLGRKMVQELDAEEVKWEPRNT